MAESKMIEKRLKPVWKIIWYNPKVICFGEEFAVTDDIRHLVIMETCDCAEEEIGQIWGL